MESTSFVNEIRRMIIARNNIRAAMHNHLTEVMFVIDVVNIAVSYCFGDRAVVPLEIAEALMDRHKKIEIVYDWGLTASIYFSYPGDTGVPMYTMQSVQRWPEFIQWDSLFDLIFTGHSDSICSGINAIFPKLFTKEKSELATRIISAGIYDGIYARVE